MIRFRRNPDHPSPDLLLGLTNAHKTWRVGLCFLNLRNLKGHASNRKRGHRIYCDLKLTQGIKPRRRKKREKPADLTVPDVSNMT